MASPYREPASRDAPALREMTPEEEMSLVLLDADCRGINRPPLLIPYFEPRLRRWLYERKLRAAGVIVPKRR